MPCDPNFLVNISMFEHLNEDDRVALANVIDELKVAEDHTLFQAGDSGDSLFIVRVGQIELFIKDTAGQKIVLTTATRRHLWRVGNAGFRSADRYGFGAN
jgi:CRP-like cAMP-binding protein